MTYEAPTPDAAPPHNEQAGQFTIVGSGVVGLLTAHELVNQGHEVTVVSNEGMPYRGTDSTSTIAVGQFLPWLPSSHSEAVTSEGSQLESIIERGNRFYAELAQNPHETGVMVVDNIELVDAADPWPSGLPEAMKVSAKNLDNSITLTNPDGTQANLGTVYDFKTFSINTRKTVAYLADLAAQKGITFEQQHIVADDLEKLDGIVINAAGMGAQELSGDQDIEYYKGHTMVIVPTVNQPRLEAAISVNDLIIMPREDGTVVVGALYIESPKRPVPESEESDELITRLTELTDKIGDLVPGLTRELFTKGEVSHHSAGYRVVANGGIRVRPDERMEHVLHAYGFSGVGWSVGPSYAKKISAQAVEMHNASKSKQEK